MKKTQIIYRCQVCGWSSSKWLGKCPECERWNTFEEEKVISDDKLRKRKLAEFSTQVYHLDDVSVAESGRIKTGISEFDRITGGGIIPGSLILLGGSPGIGKSTLMLQVAGILSSQKKKDGSPFKVLYVSGEESPKQIKLRADRLSIKSSESLFIVSETNLESIISIIEKISPDMVIMDSIQTVYKPEFSSLAGSAGQIRECSQEFLNIAKGKNIIVFLLGHITKTGDIAGPKILEHIVDTVLYFESEQTDAYRILRSYKNRFGPTSEIAVFEMKINGLEEVTNPSRIFLNERAINSAGSCIVSTVEGTRPFLLEIQALVTKTNFGLPRRVASGYDYNRMILLVSVLEKRAGIPLEGYDIYINIAGGVKINEPGIDLGVCSAIYSAYSNNICPRDTVFTGEVGLLGEIRSVTSIHERIKEAEKLGFKKIYLPSVNLKGLNFKGNIQLAPLDDVKKVFDIIIK